MIAEAIHHILRVQCTPAAVRAIEDGASPSGLWSALADAGFLELLRSDAAGGAGLSLADFHPVLFDLGRHAMPLPVAESMAARALVPDGEALPLTAVALAPYPVDHPDGGLRCHRLPWGRVATHVLAPRGDGLLLLDASRGVCTPAGGRGSQMADLHWNEAQLRSSARRIPGDATAVAAMAAACLACQLAGALSRVLEMTLQYCNDRSQFGRTLGKFQAIQHQMAEMAEEVAAASMAAQAALMPASGVRLSWLAAAVAKARASEAVPAVAGIAHAVHGAIGVTEAYDLQLFTRRLHEWRLCHGSEAFWHRQIGDAVLAADGCLTDFVRRL